MLGRPTKAAIQQRYFPGLGPPKQGPPMVFFIRLKCSRENFVIPPGCPLMTAPADTKAATASANPARGVLPGLPRRGEFKNLANCRDTIHFRKTKSHRSTRKTREVRASPIYEEQQEVSPLSGRSGNLSGVSLEIFREGEVFAQQDEPERRYLPRHRRIPGAVR